MLGFCLMVCVQGQLQYDQSRSGAGAGGPGRGVSGERSASNLLGRNLQGSNSQSRGAYTGNDGDYNAEIYYDPAYYGYESKIPGGKAMFKAYRANPEGGQVRHSYYTSMNLVFKLTVFKLMIFVLNTR